MTLRSLKIRRTRLEKLGKLRQKNINPYPVHSHREDDIQFAIDKLGEEVAIAGRIMAWRSHGGSIFADIKDGTGTIQIFFSQEKLGEKKYQQLDLFDIGDFVAVSGEVFKTNRGELTVEVHSFNFLSKSLRSLPNKRQGLKDMETRSRQRYLDLIVNEKSQKVFRQRSLIVRKFRDILDEKGFLEVETPTLQPIYGGASAQPFITHHNSLDETFYLKISDELYLKRLIIGGFDKVYEIDHNFRNEGIDKSHNPEFTLMECYQAYADYEVMMKLTEEIYEEIAKEVLGTTKIIYQGNKIDLKTPWPRLTMFAAIKKFLDWDPEKIDDKDLKKKLSQNKITMIGEFNRGLAIAALFEEVENKLIQPVFITDFPKETTSLCKLKPSNPALIERFEPYIAGFEVGNAYSELNDPLLQREFFEAQVKAKEAGDKEAPPFDEDFIKAMEYGMPPTGGLGLSVDRMVMLLTDQGNIRDVILFPTLKSNKKV